MNYKLLITNKKENIEQKKLIQNLQEEIKELKKNDKVGEKKKKFYTSAGDKEVKSTQIIRMEVENTRLRTTIQQM